MMELSCFEIEDTDELREIEFYFGELYAQEGVAAKYKDPRRAIEIIKEQHQLSKELREFSD